MTPPEQINICPYHCNSLTWRQQVSENCSASNLNRHFRQQAEWVKTTGCEVGMALAEWMKSGFGTSTGLAIATTESVINALYCFVFCSSMFFLLLLHMSL